MSDEEGSEGEGEGLQLGLSDDDVQEEDDALTGDVGKGEEAFFDDRMDYKDAEFVSRIVESHSTGKRRPRNLAPGEDVLKGRTGTDAVLSCACCFSLVCLSCQKHQRYRNQWRAVFAQNCVVDMKKYIRMDDGGPPVHPVMCETCGAEIGVFDHEEVYHFTEVIPSEC